VSSGVVIYDEIRSSSSEKSESTSRLMNEETSGLFWRFRFRVRNRARSHVTGFLSTDLIKYTNHMYSFALA